MAKKAKLNPNHDDFGRDEEEFETEGKSGGISEKDLKKFSKEYGSLKSKMDDARSPLGALFKEFEEKGGHKAALKIAHKIADMESLKAQDFWRSLEQYLDWLGVFDQHDLIDDAARAAKKEAKNPPKSATGPASALAH